MFFCKFCEILKNTFSTEHLRTTASDTSDELNTDLGNWWEYSGDKLCVMNLRWSNFVAQDNKCDDVTEDAKSGDVVQDEKCGRSGGTKLNPFHISVPFLYPLEIVIKFTGKHLCQCLFFNKVAGLGLEFY